jgi:hypothetical protein
LPVCEKNSATTASSRRHQIDSRRGLPDGRRQ